MLLKGAVIGSSIQAAYYALVNEYCFIPSRKMPIMFYESPEVSLFGLNKAPDIWSRLNLMLGLLSKRIAFEDTSNIRVTDDIIKITTGNLTFKYHFERLFIFDPTGIQTESEIQKVRPRTFIVFDDFELSVLGPRRYELEPITKGSGFARELHFYCSGRVDGSDYITDCVMESELSYEELNSFDYSDSIARFVVERHLTSAEVYGRFMKYYNSGKPKYRKPKVVHVKRVSHEKDNNQYRDTEKVKFLDLSLRQIIEESTKR